MEVEMKIDMADRDVLLKQYAVNYQHANKKDKGQILDVFVKVTGYQRVYGARLLRMFVQKT